MHKMPRLFPCKRVAVESIISCGTTCLLSEWVGGGGSPRQLEKHGNSGCLHCEQATVITFINMAVASL